MLTGVFRCPATLAFLDNLELQTAFIAVIDVAFFHVRAVDHSSLLIVILALNYIQHELIIK